MQYRYLTFSLFFLMFGGLVKAQNNPKTTAQGARYTIINPQTGDRIKQNDVVTFNLAIQTEKDSVLMSSFLRGKPFSAQVQPSKSIDDLMEIFPLLTAKDSVRILIPADSLFKNREQERPPFLTKGTSIVYLLKIDKVQTLDQAIADRKAAEAKMQEAATKLKTDEQAKIAKFIANQPNIKTTTSGLYYQITQPSAKPKPLPGDTLLVNYIGKTLEGKVFDTNSKTEAEKAGVFQPGRPYEPFQFIVKHGDVIPGWDEGFLLLNQGSKARLIIPSKLAYGPNQSGPDIAPYSPLIFDVELLSIKAGKHPVVPKKAPVKKAPVKKALVKKAVKKPVAAKKK